MYLLLHATETFGDYVIGSPVLGWGSPREERNPNWWQKGTMSTFSSELDSHEVALFFFAGHGMQIGGKNYLTAVDTNFDTEIDAKYK